MEKEKKVKQLKISIIVAVCIIVIPILIGGIVMLKQDSDKKKQIAAEEARLAAQVEVPDVKGMTINEARETLNKVNLEISLTDYDKQLTESNPNEYVVESQYPSAKEKADKNTEIKVFFKELMVVESNNFYGMRFKKTIADFCENYNKAIETISTKQGKNDLEVKAAKEINCIEDTSFSYIRFIG